VVIVNSSGRLRAGWHCKQNSGQRPART
jgi:hypothetical protein